MRRIMKVSLVAAREHCTGSVILLHGAGGTGPNLQSWFSNEMGRDLHYRHLRLLFPTAVPIDYTPCQGFKMHAWIDRLAIDISVPEMPSSIDDAVDSLSQLIDAEISRGIPASRIVIGGFSMGGTMALHVGYGAKRDLAGVFALSSFLNHESAVYGSLDRSSEYKELPKLFQCHGSADDLVHHAWGKETYSQLTARGVQGEFHTIPDLEHSLHGGILKKWDHWLTTVLPPT